VAGGPLITNVDSGGTPSTTNEEFWDGDVPWLTPKEITGLTDGLFVSQTERNITQIGLASSAAKLLPPGTVLLSKRAPVGAVAVNAVPLATNQGFLNFRCGSMLRPLYFAYWLRANTPYLHLIANGSTYPELYKGDLFEFELAVPALAVQDKTVAVLNSLQYAALLGPALEQSVEDPAKMLRLQDQSRRLGRIRDTLLPLLLSGQIDVEDLSTKLIAGKAK
jgi:type I restriction enzyme S subunit